MKVYGIKDEPLNCRCTKAFQDLGQSGKNVVKDGILPILTKYNFFSALPKDLKNEICVNLAIYNQTEKFSANKLDRNHEIILLK